MGQGVRIGAWLVAVSLMGPAAMAWAQEAGDEAVGASRILELIEANGDFAFAEASADIGIARARQSKARAALYPNLGLTATGQRYQSSEKWRADNAEIYGTLEVVQPIYDFGRSSAEIDATGSDVAAAEEALSAAQGAVLLEGLALYYDLHASELLLRAKNEDHASAYVHWDRAKEQLGLGRASPVEVAETLTLVEKTRLVYYRERSRNNMLRLRLEELTGLTFDKELIAPPPPPGSAPPDIDREKFAQVVIDRNPALKGLVKQAEAAGIRREAVTSLPSIEAFGNVGHTSRNLRGRNEYAVGARLSWPIFDGGINSAERSRLAAEQSRILSRLENKRRELRLKTYEALMGLENSYQQVVSALAQHDFASKSLLRRQQLYSQERVADLGRAMIENTASEADLVRATGAYLSDLAAIAVMIGEHPARALEDGFLAGLDGVVHDRPDGQYTPKGGSGFGQEDQDKVNRRIE